MSMQRWKSNAVVGPELCTNQEAMAYARVTQKTEAPLFDDLITAARELFEEICHRIFVVQQGVLTIDSIPNWNLGWWNGTREGALASYQSRALPTVNPPLISLDALNYYDLSNGFNMYNPAEYFVDQSDPLQIARVCLNIGSIWPVNLRRHAAVALSITCGYGQYVGGSYTPPAWTSDQIFTPGFYAGGSWQSTAPRRVVTALKMLVAYLYEHRGEEPGTSAVESSGAMGYLRTFILPEPGITRTVEDIKSNQW